MLVGLVTVVFPDAEPAHCNELQLFGNQLACRPVVPIVFNLDRDDIEGNASVSWMLHV